MYACMGSSLEDSGAVQYHTAYQNAFDVVENDQQPLIFMGKRQFCLYSVHSGEKPDQVSKNKLFVHTHTHTRTRTHKQTHKQTHIHMYIHT